MAKKKKKYLKQVSFQHTKWLHFEECRFGVTQTNRNFLRGNR